MNQILRRAARRLPRVILTAFIVATGTFFLGALLPGDAALALVGESGASPEALAAVRHDLGLDLPLPIRYVRWLGQLLHGDFGFSQLQHASVGTLIAARLPVTIELMVLSIVIALALSIPAGIASAYMRGTFVDHLISTITYGLLAVPGFVVALLLILVIAVEWRLLPATGWTALTDDPGQNARAVILPALTLAIGQLAVFTRLVRTEMISTLQEDFIAMAAAKGMPTWRILFVHAFRPSALPLITVVGIQMGVLMSGTVIVESIFAVPGIGSLLINAISLHDFPVVQTVTILVATAFVTINFVVDMLYEVLDPRVRAPQYG